jgi:hypothetical protein
MGEKMCCGNPAPWKNKKQFFHAWYLFRKHALVKGKAGGWCCIAARSHERNAKSMGCGTAQVCYIAVNLYPS